MFKNFLKKQEKEGTNNKNVLIIALLIHAAKIDKNYTCDSYESTLIRRICGLLYVSDKDSGIIKKKIENLYK